MNIRKLCRLFKKYSYLVCGMRGRGKDILFANITCRRKEPYISNTDYGGKWLPFEYEKLNCGNNTYDNFITGDILYYETPYEDGTDIYLADIGVYFPAQYCNELNRKYPQMATLQALLRHIQNASFHANVQAPHRAWDKIREHYDKFLMCEECYVLFHKLVIQEITIYERYKSFEDHVPPFPLRKPLFSPERRFQWEMLHTNYLISHGEIKRYRLIYFNKSKYCTRIFKEMMKNGRKI